ncbi:hypothetical protein HYT57_04615 [Candidatus Woesearchaeota archaeon]|nr:hypothetical protein [Candidatus Woesearchaeota archaeon]
MNLEAFLRKAELGEGFNVEEALMQIPGRMRHYFRELSTRLGRESMIFLVACADFYDNPERTLEIIKKTFPATGMERVNFQMFYRKQEEGYRRRKASRTKSDPDLIMFAIEGLCPESPGRKVGKYMAREKIY